MSVKACALFIAYLISVRDEVYPIALFTLALRNWPAKMAVLFVANENKHAVFSTNQEQTQTQSQLEFRAISRAWRGSKL